MLLVFERAMRGDADLEVMLAGVPDHPPRTLHSVTTNPYNIQVTVPSEYKRPKKISKHFSMFPV